MPPVDWVCPECHGALEPQGTGDLHCPRDGIDFKNRNGIPNLLTDERLEHYHRFLEEYRIVRRHEGRASIDLEGYRVLPRVGPDHPHRAEWKIRAVSYHRLVTLVVEPLTRERGPLAVADLGAGNGWMSRRLAMAGHRVAAVDILDDDSDGLGAHLLSEHPFDTARAEFDRLPVASETLDLVVFNGALHYSTSYGRTLGEALRVLRPGGVVAVLDSPFYRSRGPGEAMVEERRAAFLQTYGFASDSIPCRGFLTFGELDRLAESLGLTWLTHRPFYGFRWALRPLEAILRGRREPATFLVLWAKKPGPTES